MSPPKLYMSHGDEVNESPEMLQFEALLEKYDYAFTRGEIVKGTIIVLEPGGALVDIGGKTAAFLPNKEISSSYTTAGASLTVGDSCEFIILVEEDEDGQITLSLRRVEGAQNWKKLEELMEQEIPVTCKIVSVVKGGLLVEVIGLRGFIPSSHLRLKQPPEEMISQEIQAKVINLDKARNNIILSHRKMLSEQMAEQRKDLFSQLEEGSFRSGEVVRLTDFGAFIDLGGVDGLLPLSQMSWRWVEHPSDILKIGEKVDVQIIGIDHERQRVSLSIKGQNTDPWNEVATKMGLGDLVENGTVTRLKHFGAFVEIYPGVEALLPSRDIVEYESRNQLKLEVGNKINTYILKFSPDERRISLGFNPLSPEAFRGGRIAQEEPGTVVEH